MDYTQEQKDKAVSRASEKLDFFQHLSIYLVINIMVFFINLLASPNQWWFYWCAIGWGIGLVIHGLSVFIFNGWMSGLKDKLIESELKKIKK